MAVQVHACMGRAGWGSGPTGGADLEVVDVAVAVLIERLPDTAQDGGAEVELELLTGGTEFEEIERAL